MSRPDWIFILFTAAQDYVKAHDCVCNIVNEKCFRCQVVQAIQDAKKAEFI
jgi:hypothetical protein